MGFDARSVRLQAQVADAVGGGALRSLGFKVSPSGKTGQALVAETELQRARGLRGGDLGKHDAMMFAWPADHSTPITMQGVNQDLELAWLDEAGGLLGSVTMRAGQPMIRPPGPYRHAMEFPVGSLSRLGISDGSAVAFEDDGSTPLDIPRIDPAGRWAAPAVP